MLNITYNIQHLTLRADNESAMRTFYRDILGLIEKQDTHQVYSYAFTKSDAPFLTLQFDGHKNIQPHQGLYHFALLFPDTASLASIIERLLLIEYPLGAGDHDVSEAFYLNDPNGNGIELYHDRPKELWQWDNDLVQMGTKDVDAQALLQQKQTDWSGFPDKMTIGHLHFVGNHVTRGDEFFIATLKMALTSTVSDSAHFYSHNHYHHHHAYNTWLGPDVTPRQAHDTGLLNWTVTVDHMYFNSLKTNLNDQNTSTVANELWLTDPFGSQLIIRNMN